VEIAAYVIVILLLLMALALAAGISGLAALIAGDRDPGRRDGRR
jgi:hypothetical protein